MIQIGTKEVKLLVFADDVMVYISVAKNSVENFYTDKHLQLCDMMQDLLKNKNQ